MQKISPCIKKIFTINKKLCDHNILETHHVLRKCTPYIDYKMFTAHYKIIKEMKLIVTGAMNEANTRAS